MFHREGGSKQQNAREIAVRPLLEWYHEGKRTTSGTAQVHSCWWFLFYVHLVVSVCAPRSGEALLFSSRHPVQLAPVALHPAAGKHLAGLDLLLTCSWMPYVSEPFLHVIFCHVRRILFPFLLLGDMLYIGRGVWGVSREVSARFFRASLRGR